MNLTLREATPDDAALIANISQLTFQHTFAAANTPEDMHFFLTQQFTRGKLMLEVGKPDLCFLLAYAGDEVAGYVKLRNAPPPPESGLASGLEIARLYAMPGMIGKGVGTLLMQAAITAARDAGKDGVWLGVWESNQRAIAFYHRWGFQKFGEVDFLLGTDLQRDWVMGKKLNS
jgi:ribosomal protein S18 acetylase RimI-like enzyme